MSNDRKPLNEGYKPKTNNDSRGYQPNSLQHGYQPTSVLKPKVPSTGSQVPIPKSKK